MKKLILLIILLLGLTSNSQIKNKAFDPRYFYHWETITPRELNMQIIIHKERGKTHVTEIRINNECALNGGVMYATVYICKNKKGRMVVETIDPSLMQINDSEYILTSDKRLLRVTQQDTLIFKRKY